MEVYISNNAINKDLRDNTSLTPEMQGFYKLTYPFGWFDSRDNDSTKLNKEEAFVKQEVKNDSILKVTQILQRIKYF